MGDGVHLQFLDQASAESSSLQSSTQQQPDPKFSATSVSQWSQYLTQPV